MKPEDIFAGIAEEEEQTEERLSLSAQLSTIGLVATLRARLWDILQNPETSASAKVFALISLSMIFVSVSTSCLETVPSLKDKPWHLNELTLNSWFLMELSLSALTTPEPHTFFTSTMTWIDVVAVVPYFLLLAISPNQMSSFSFMRIIRLVRITRLFRLSKHSGRLKIVGNILLSSLQEFKTLSMCVSIIVILIGSVMYSLEGGGVEGTMFDSIPMGFYWGIQTITTVGYGDIYPTTVGGMVFASAYMVFGAVTLSVPLLSIVAKFESQYVVSR